MRDLATRYLGALSLEPSLEEVAQRLLATAVDQSRGRANARKVWRRAAEPHGQCASFSPSFTRGMKSGRRKPAPTGACSHAAWSLVGHYAAGYPIPLPMAHRHRSHGRPTLHLSPLLPSPLPLPSHRRTSPARIPSSPPPSPSQPRPPSSSSQPPPPLPYPAARRRAAAPQVDVVPRHSGSPEGERRLRRPARWAHLLQGASRAARRNPPPLPNRPLVAPPLVRARSKLPRLPRHPPPGIPVGL